MGVYLDWQLYPSVAELRMIEKNWAASKSCSIPPRSLRSAHTICVYLYVAVVSILFVYNVKSIYFLIIRSSMYVRTQAVSKTTSWAFAIVCLSEKEENNYLILFSCQRRSIEVDLFMSRNVSDLLCIVLKIAWNVSSFLLREQWCFVKVTNRVNWMHYSWLNWIWALV